MEEKIEEKKDLIEYVKSAFLTIDLNMLNKKKSFETKFYIICSLLYSLNEQLKKNDNIIDVRTCNTELFTNSKYDIKNFKARIKHTFKKYKVKPIITCLTFIIDYFAVVIDMYRWAIMDMTERSQYLITLNVNKLLWCYYIYSRNPNTFKIEPDIKKFTASIDAMSDYMSKFIDYAFISIARSKVEPIVLGEIENANLYFTGFIEFTSTIPLLFRSIIYDDIAYFTFTNFVIYVLKDEIMNIHYDGIIYDLDKPIEHKFVPNLAQYFQYFHTYRNEEYEFTIKGNILEITKNKIVVEKNNSFQFIYSFVVNHVFDLIKYQVPEDYIRLFFMICNQIFNTSKYFGDYNLEVMFNTEHVLEAYNVIDEINSK